MAIINALIAVSSTSGLQVGHKLQGGSNKVLQRNKLLPLLISGVTFHFIVEFVSLFFGALFLVSIQTQ